MRRSATPPLRLVRRLAAVAALITALSACGPPGFRYTASDADDIVVKVPRAWALVNSGVPASSDGTQPDAGNWFAVYDAAAKPSMDHVSAVHTTAPVAVVRTVVVTKEQGQTLTDDTLRDLFLPVSAKARASAPLQGFSGTGFKLLTDQKVSTGTADGIHVVFGYDLGQGTEMFDQIVLTDKNKTRVHLLLVHCNAGCYESNREVIMDSVRSFTVRRI